MIMVTYRYRLHRLTTFSLHSLAARLVTFVQTILSLFVSIPGFTLVLFNICYGGLHTDNSDTPIIRGSLTRCLRIAMRKTKDDPK